MVTTMRELLHYQLKKLAVSVPTCIDPHNIVHAQHTVYITDGRISDQNKE